MQPARPRSTGCGGSTLAVAVVTFVVAALYAWWIGGDPRVLAALGTEEELRQLADEGFVAYYSENPAASFAGAVWTNNAWIAAQCVAFGILGVWVPCVILQNAQNLGVTAAVMFAYDEADTFFLYIAPHGLLELTCVFVAAAAGLRIFWAWVAPGPRSRGVALAEDARSLFSVAIGLVFFLFVSGLIEGFVTPAPWPWPVKIGIGVLALGGVPGLHARARRSGVARRRDRRPRRVRRRARAHRRRMTTADAPCTGPPASEPTARPADLRAGRSPSARGSSPRARAAARAAPRSR